MKKIMFNDKYGLTEAVLNGRKTMTRRIIQNTDDLYSDIRCMSFSHLNDKGNAIMQNSIGFAELFPSYKVGEVVAVAQCLRDMRYDARDTRHKSGAIWGLDHTPAWTNKMFVSASDCINKIRITNIRVERLHDISDENCLREGIKQMTFDTFSFDSWKFFTRNPREAFAALIDKVSGKGTWESNPYVFVYEFELVK